MTTAPTTADQSPVPVRATDATPIDFAARGPLLLLIGSGLLWLVISGVLSLVTSIQLHSPHFLSQYSFLTYGRAEALRQTAFVYGWAANAGLAVALWTLGRLGGNPIRARNWAFIGAGFWNVGLTVGLVGIAAGNLTSFSLFQLPRYVQPLMTVAYGAIAVVGVLSWSDRRADRMFAAQWYAVAALFLFPWLSSIAQLTLLWSPMRGVAQAVAAGWYAQGVWAFWLAPIALSGAYFVVAKSSGRTLPSYEVAPLGFWTLIVIGAWAGGRSLVNGPVPAWIGTVGVVASVMMLVHYFVVTLNLGSAWTVKGTGPGFIRFGVVAYALAGIVDAVTSFRSVAVETQFTFVGMALEQLALYGGVSMMLFGSIYFMVPRLTGHSWVSPVLTVGHRIIVSLGVIVLVATFAVAGWSQGVDLLDPKTSFSDILDHSRLPLLMLSGAQLVLLFGNTLLLVNFLQTIGRSVVADVVALNPIGEQTEVTAS